MIFDTDVLIWALRGNDRAIKAIDSEPTRLISAITYMEILKGARNKSEFREIRRYLLGMGFRTIHINEDISSRAVSLVEIVCLKSDMGVSDALIFATALHCGETLLSGNYHHFKEVPNLAAVRFSPFPAGKSQRASTFAGEADSAR